MQKVADWHIQMTCGRERELERTKEREAARDVVSGGQGAAALDASPSSQLNAASKGVRKSPSLR